MTKDDALLAEIAAVQFAIVTALGQLDSPKPGTVLTALAEVAAHWVAEIARDRPGLHELMVVGFHEAFDTTLARELESRETSDGLSGLPIPRQKFTF